MSDDLTFLSNTDEEAVAQEAKKLADEAQRLAEQAEAALELAKKRAQLAALRAKERAEERAREQAEAEERRRREAEALINEANENAQKALDAANKACELAQDASNLDGEDVREAVEKARDFISEAERYISAVEAKGEKAGEEAIAKAAEAKKRADDARKMIYEVDAALQEEAKRNAELMAQKLAAEAEAKRKAEEEAANLAKRLQDAQDQILAKKEALQREALKDANEAQNLAAKAQTALGEAKEAQEANDQNETKQKLEETKGFARKALGVAGLVEAQGEDAGEEALEKALDAKTKAQNTLDEAVALRARIDASERAHAEELAQRLAVAQEAKDASLSKAAEQAVAAVEAANEATNLLGVAATQNADDAVASIRQARLKADDALKLAASAQAQCGDDKEIYEVAEGAKKAALAAKENADSLESQIYKEREVAAAAKAVADRANADASRALEFAAKAKEQAASALNAKSEDEARAFLRGATDSGLDAKRLVDAVEAQGEAAGSEALAKANATKELLAQASNLANEAEQKLAQNSEAKLDEQAADALNLAREAKADAQSVSDRVCDGEAVNRGEIDSCRERAQEALLSASGLRNGATPARLAVLDDATQNARDALKLSDKAEADLAKLELKLELEQKAQEQSLADALNALEMAKKAFAEAEAAVASKDNALIEAKIKEAQRLKDEAEKLLFAIGKKGDFSGEEAQNIASAGAEALVDASRLIEEAKANLVKNNAEKDALEALELAKKAFAEAEAAVASKDNALIEEKIKEAQRLKEEAEKLLFAISKDGDAAGENALNLAGDGRALLANTALLIEEAKANLVKNSAQKDAEEALELARRANELLNEARAMGGEDVEAVAQADAALKEALEKLSNAQNLVYDASSIDELKEMAAQRDKDAAREEILANADKVIADAQNDIASGVNADAASAAISEAQRVKELLDKVNLSGASIGGAGKLGEPKASEEEIFSKIKEAHELQNRAEKLVFGVDNLGNKAGVDAAQNATDAKDEIQKALASAKEAQANIVKNRALEDAKRANEIAQKANLALQEARALSGEAEIRAKIKEVEKLQDDAEKLVFSIDKLGDAAGEQAKATNEATKELIAQTDNGVNELLAKVVKEHALQDANMALELAHAAKDSALDAREAESDGDEKEALRLLGKTDELRVKARELIHGVNKVGKAAGEEALEKSKEAESLAAQSQEIAQSVRDAIRAKNAKLNRDLHDRLNDTEAELYSTSAKLDATSAKLSDTEAELYSTSAELDATAERLNLTAAQLEEERTRRVLKTDAKRSLDFANAALREAKQAKALKGEESNLKVRESEAFSADSDVLSGRVLASKLSDEDDRKTAQEAQAVNKTAKELAQKVKIRQEALGGGLDKADAEANEALTLAKLGSLGGEGALAKLDEAQRLAESSLAFTDKAKTCEDAEVIGRAKEIEVKSKRALKMVKKAKSSTTSWFANLFRNDNAEGKNGRYKGALTVSLLLSIIILAVQSYYSFVTKSVAFGADSALFLTHVVSLAFSWYALNFAKDGKGKFGYYKIAPALAVFSGLVLALVGVGVVVVASLRFVTPVFVDLFVMLIVCAACLLAKSVVGLIMLMSNTNEINAKASLAHVVTDTISALAVIAVGVVAYFTAWLWLENVLAILIGLFIIRWALSLMVAGVRFKK